MDGDASPAAPENHHHRAVNPVTDEPTAHPTGEQQAEENEDVEPPA